MNRKQRRAERRRNEPTSRAKPLDYREAFALAVQHHQAGRLIEALPHYRAAIRDLSADALGRGATSEAVVRSQLAAIQYNFGSALQGAGRTGEALDAYAAALTHDPGFAEAHYNVGIARQGLGDVSGAIASYRRALEHRPDLVEARYNLAVMLTHREPDAAIEAYRRILTSHPDFPAATRNLALLLSRQGDHAAAAEMFIGCLKSEDTSDFKAAFVEIMEHVRWTRDDGAARSLFQAALMEPWGRPHKLVRSAVSLLMRDPAIAACVARVTAAETVHPAQDLIASAEFAQTAADPLLNALLVSAPICDVGLETFLRAVRSAFLEQALQTFPSQSATEKLLPFLCALAQQCFLNEYVYPQTDDETRTADALRDLVNDALESGADIPVLSLAAVATFHPLASLPCADRLLQRRWPEPVMDVLAQQVAEPAQEAIERASVPRLTDIDDPTSMIVRDQYEESPYPRWAKIAPLGGPRTIAGFLSDHFPSAERSSFAGGAARVLIAGCGTGQHAIETAWRFANCQVTAIDISLNSLAYAKRKTSELSLKSLEYLQADLLRLDPSGQSFDMIESVGTLHHMADPWEGWKALLAVLRPNGLMKIGLYSAAARRSVERARRVIAEQGWSATPDEIRRARQDLAALEATGGLENITTNDDFFTLSGCRDLFFHVQEHRFTLTAIESFLRENQLRFLGFESLGAGVLNAYRRRFPDDPTGTNLAQWQAFEDEHPNTFPMMYQFWVQKAHSDGTTSPSG